jgi:membrane-associated phospholipid phosphatase
MTDAALSESRPPPSSFSGKRPNATGVVPWIVAPLLIGLLAASFAVDDVVIRWVSQHDSVGVKAFARTVSRVLDWPTVLALLGIGAFVLRKLAHRELARIAFAVFLSAAICGLSGTILRSLLGRTRPSAPVPQGWFGPYHDGHWTLGEHAYSAFPSGHTSTLAGAAGLLLLARPVGGSGLFALTLLVGWSRIYLGAHRLSDVVGAIVLGAIGSTIIWVLLNRHGRAGPSVRVELRDPHI